MTILDPSFADLIQRTREEASGLQSFAAIFEKVEQDGTLRVFSETFRRVLDQELVFAYQGNLTRIAESKKRTRAGVKRSETPSGQSPHFQAESQTDFGSKS